MKDLVIGLRAAGRDAAGIRDAAIAAEKAGIDVAWSTSGGLQADPLVAFAAAAGSTERIGFGTSIVPTFPRHPFALAQEAVAFAEDLRGHTIGAAEIAAVGHGDAQIAQRAFVLILDHGSSL